MTHDEIETYAKANGHPPVAKGVVLVDFDATISPWGDLFGFPEPLEGAVEFNHWLNDQGYKVVLFTSRLSTVWHNSEGREPLRAIYEQVAYLRAYAERYNLQFDAVTAEKIPAIAYIDDKAVEFKDWKQAARRFKQKVKE